MNETKNDVMGIPVTQSKNTPSQNPLQDWEDDALKPVEAEVEIADIVERPDWQVRHQVSHYTVRDYMLRYMYGQQFPPIRLANVNGALVLIDGWHRLAAQRKLKDADGVPRTRVQTTVETLTEDEARWQAALANTRNGLPLKHRERVNVFHAYVKTGQHRRGKRGYKSYREIARELGGIAPFVTVYRWMKQHYPKIAKRMADHDHKPRDNQEGKPRQTRLGNLKAALQGAVREAVAEAKGLCPTARLALAEILAVAAREGAEAIREAKPWTPQQAVEEPTDF